VCNGGRIEAAKERAGSAELTIPAESAGADV